MGLDIRLPIGLMFSVLGPIVLVAGLLSHTALNTRTGAAMLLFGLVMLGLGLRGQRHADVDAPTSDPEATRRPGGH